MTTIANKTPKEVHELLSSQLKARRKALSSGKLSAANEARVSAEVEELEEALSDVQDIIERDTRESPADTPIQGPKEGIVEEIGPPDVRMSQAMRRKLGDLIADFLDEYAEDFQRKILNIFEQLHQDVDVTEETEIRAQIIEQVGLRGLNKVTPLFSEWRRDLIKKVQKEVKSLFDAEEGEDEVVSEPPPVPAPVAPSLSVAPSMMMPEPQPPAERTLIEVLPPDPLAEPPVTASAAGISSRITLHRDMKIKASTTRLE